MASATEWVLRLLKTAIFFMELLIWANQKALEFIFGKTDVNTKAISKEVEKKVLDYGREEVRNMLVNGEWEKQMDLVYLFIQPAKSMRENGRCS